MTAPQADYFKNRCVQRGDEILAGFIMTVKLRMPTFQNGKEKRRFLKAIVAEIDKRYNQHIDDLGNWPLIIQFFDDDQSEFCSLFFGKAMEPSENPVHTMNNIIAFIRKDLSLNIYSIKRSPYD